MKDLKDAICEANVNEAREYIYNVSVDAVKDNEGLPVTVTMSIDAKYHKQFEAWLDKQLGNEFGHACGYNNDYEGEF